MAGRRSGAPRDGDSAGFSEWERSPWSEYDGDPPPLGGDVLSSDQTARRSTRRSKPEPVGAVGPVQAVEPEEEPPPQESSWFQQPKPRLLAIAAAVVGMLVGAVVVHGYDAQRAAQARRDAVSLTARVAEGGSPRSSSSGSLAWVLRLIITNSGETNIKIRGATLADHRFQSRLREVSEDTQIRAGQESWVSLDVTNSCVDGGPAPAPQNVELSVVPEGRPSRNVQIRLADDSDQMVDAMRQNCLNPNTDIWTDAELAGPAVARRNTLDVPVRIHLVGPEALAVRQLRTSTPGLSVVAAPLPVRFTDGVTAQTVLHWTVASCPRAKVVTYAEIGISATVMMLTDAESIVTDAVLDANAVLAIVRFITTTCQ